MINVRQGLVELLQATSNVTTAINVESTRVDKVKQEDCPALSVLNVSTTQTQLGHHLQFNANTTVGIIILVAKTDTYADDLDTLVDLVLGSIFTDPNWQTSFESVPEFQISYDYGIGGETDIAQARILITVEYNDEYPVVIPDDFDTLHIDLDMSEPDGVIETTLDIDLSVL